MMDRYGARRLTPFQDLCYRLRWAHPGCDPLEWTKRPEWVADVTRWRNLGAKPPEPPQAA